MGNCFFCCFGVDRMLYKWKIEGFSSLLEPGEGDATSGTFEAEGCMWSLHVMTTKNEDGKSYVSLRLCIEDVPPGSKIQAKYNLLIYDQKHSNHIKETGSSNFMTTQCAGGFHYMILLETLKDASSGLLIDDICIFGVEIVSVVRTSNYKVVSDSLSLYRRTTHPVLYTWWIESRTNLQRPFSSSEAIHAGGLKWYIILFADGEIDDKYLSIFLKLDEWDAINLESGVLVEFSLCVTGLINGKCKKISFNAVFSFKYAVVGDLQFVPYEDLRDPSMGLQIDASVSVVGLVSRQ